jgi:DNA-binding NtrC family response regulator
MSAKRVVVVDDHGGIRELCKSVLEKAGYVVTTAETASEGLTLVRGFRPHLLLTDNDLGRGGTGTELAERVQSIAPFLSIIMMTADRDINHVLNVTEIIRKPFVNEELIELVEKARSVRAFYFIA